VSSLAMVLTTGVAANGDLRSQTRASHEMPRSTLAMGQQTGNVTSSSSQTRGVKAAPIGRRHLVKTAWRPAKSSRLAKHDNLVGSRINTNYISSVLHSQAIKYTSRRGPRDTESL
jgi:hypothetical protein